MSWQVIAASDADAYDALPVIWQQLTCHAVVLPLQFDAIVYDYGFSRLRDHVVIIDM